MPPKDKKVNDDWYNVDPYFVSEDKGRIKLEYALEAVDRSTVKKLLSRPKTCLPISPCPGGWSALFWSIGQKRGDSKDRELLVHYVAKIVSQIRTSVGLPPSHVNERDNDGQTPLHWAAALNKPGVCRVLYRLGGRLDVLDNDGNTPLAWAISSSDPENGTGREQLVDNSDSIEQIVTLSPSAVNLAPKEGRLRNWTALHQAVYEGRKAYLEIMLPHASVATMRRVEKDAVKDDLTVGARDFKRRIAQTSEKARAQRQQTCLALVKKERERKSTWLKAQPSKREREESMTEGQVAKRPQKYAPVPKRRHTTPVQPDVWPKDVVYTRHMVLPPDVEDEKRKRHDFESGVFEYYAGPNKKKINPVIDENFEREIREAIAFGPIDEVVVQKIDDPDDPVCLCQNELFPGKTQEFGGTFGLFARPGVTIPKGKVIGEYVGELKRETQIQEETSFLGENSAYDLLYNFPLTWSKKWHGATNPEDTLMIDASSTRGEIPFTNDYWGFSYQEPRKKNSEFVEIVVDKWPHVFLISTCEIQGGEEILTCYGREYWDKMENNLGMMQEHKKLLDKALVDQEMRFVEELRPKLSNWVEGLQKDGKMTKKQAELMIQTIKNELPEGFGGSVNDPVVVASESETSPSP